MYGANITHSQLQRYLALLVDRGLLRIGGEGRAIVYEPTEMGEQFLKDCEDLLDRLGFHKG